MRRLRKLHKQLALPKLDKNGQKRGGRRAGAGRKPKDGRKCSRPGEPHKRRPQLLGRNPNHIVVRVLDVFRNLRKRHMYHALRNATIAVAMRELAYDEVKGAFRIVHISIQRNHIHLLVEADNKRALSRGMQSFLISAARQINRAYSVKLGLAGPRRGSVFADRYHCEVITSPRQARSALAYVLKNASHCTYRGKRVEFPTSGSHTRLLQGAQRVLRYRRPSFEDFVWGWASMPLPGKIDFKVRYGPGVPEQLHS